MNTKKVMYSGFTVRYATLYDWIKNADQKHRVEFSQKICAHLNESKNELQKHFNIVFKQGIVTLKDGKFGSYIEYPEFTKQFKNGTSATITIRINPCYADQYDDNREHYSKVWSIIKSMPPLSIDGDNVDSLLTESKEFCKELNNAVGELYISIFSKDSKKISDYFTSIESVAIDLKETDITEYSSLFCNTNKEEFLRKYKTSYASQKSFSDLTKWVAEQKIDNPLDFIAESVKDDISWRVLKEDQVNVFYGQQNKDECFRIVGLGIDEQNDPEQACANIDRIFLTKVATLISAL